MGNYRAFADSALLLRMEELVQNERGAISDALACLAEVDRRKLYAGLGYSDIFDYCVRHLKYSVGSAYRRIHSARAAQSYPEIYADIRDGTLSLCVVALIAPDLVGADAKELLSASRGKSKREVAEWLAARRPVKAAAPDRIRARPPLPLPSQELTSPIAPSSLLWETASLIPKQPTFEYTFVASAKLHRAIERLKDLLWNKLPFGNLEDYLGVVLVEYLDRHEPELSLKMQRPKVGLAQTNSRRRVPKVVRDHVWARDGGRCSFIPKEGLRCQCRRGLELDHIVPYSVGGRSDEESNIRLLCREHNQFERRRKLGE